MAAEYTQQRLKKGVHKDGWDEVADGWPKWLMAWPQLADGWAGWLKDEGRLAYVLGHRWMVTGLGGQMAAGC